MSVPMHVQLADLLRGRIHEGDLPVGAPLPTEAALVKESGSSRGTVRQAIATLRNEGLVSGGQGRPSVVRAAPIGQPFETFLSFTAWALQSGRLPGQKTIEISRRAASPAAAEALGLASGSAVVDVLRLRFLDDEPVMLERSSFVERVGRLLFDTDPDGHSIYAYLIERGVDLHDARHTIDAVGADAVDARLLQVADGSPLLRERRRACARDGEPLEYADDRYRPDRVAFTIDNHRAARPSVVRALSDPGRSC